LCSRRGRKHKRFSGGISHPTGCLGGGYDLLENKITDEKLQRLREASGSDEVISPPSPPSRHEKWKLARTKPRG